MQGNPMQVDYRSLLTETTQKPAFWFSGMLLGLMALHLALYWRLINDFDQLCLHAVFWGVLIYLLWNRRQSIVLSSDPVSSFFGLFLISLVLARSFNTHISNDIL